MASTKKRQLKRGNRSLTE